LQILIFGPGNGAQKIKKKKVNKTNPIVKNIFPFVGFKICL